MGAGEIEGLGGGDTGDQAIRDLGRGRQGRRMPGAAQKQVTVDFVGNQDQIAFGTEQGEGADLLDRPDGPARIMRAAEKHDFGARREFCGERIEVHRVAALTQRQLRVEDASLIGENDLSESMIGRWKDHDLVAGFGDGLKDQAQSRDDAGRRADPGRVDRQAVPARHPFGKRDRPTAGVGIIAMDGAGDGGGQGFRDAWRRRKIHVGDPHRDPVRCRDP